MITRDEFERDFENFVARMGSTLFKKNHDYTGQNEDPLYNFRKAENWGVDAWRGACVRFSDKISRLETFAKKEFFEVDDENFEDTLKDGANYLFLIGELYKEYKRLKEMKNAKDNEAAKDSNRSTVISGEENSTITQ